MTFGLTDLNAEIADCWKLVWNVEPAALMVPLAELDETPPDDALLLDVAPVDALLVDEDEEHAAPSRPAVYVDIAYRVLLMGFICSSAALSSPGRP